MVLKFCTAVLISAGVPDASAKDALRNLNAYIQEVWW